MKRNLLLLSLLINIIGYTQPGKDCNNPYIIPSIPFSLTGLTTQGYGNDYNETMACNSQYMSGNDFVFSYTPQTNHNINISLSNTGVLVGLFILDGCPDNQNTQCIAKAEASNGNPQIANVALQAGINYYIIVDTYNAANLFPSTNFNISIDYSYNRDIASRWIYKPDPGCHLNNQTQMKLIYRNMGLVPIDTVVCAYQIDNNPPVYQTSYTTINPDESFYMTFNQLADMSLSPHNYRVKMWASCTNDENRSNDTLEKWIFHGINVNTFPYIEDFETNDGYFSTGWTSDIQPGTSWQWGTPTANVINHAASGNKCWVTNLSGYYNGFEKSYLLAPCFDFSTLTSPIVEFDIWYETTPTDLIKLEYSIDSGDTWIRIGNVGDGINWYNTPSGYNDAGWNGSTGQWIHALHDLSFLAGQPYVLIRFYFLGGINGTNEGVAIDNFKVSESPIYDANLKYIISPVDSCELTISPFTILVTNTGLSDISNIPVTLIIDNQQAITEVITDTISQNEIYYYTTQHTFDLSTKGQHLVTIYTDLTNDGNRLNDTIHTIIMNYPLINNYAYFEDFEQNNGYWYTYGTNNSWQWGIPNDTVLLNAASGTHLWATNLNGYHNLAEESYVQSPCFDLTSLNNPVFKAKIWYDQTYPTYTQIQYFNIIWNTLGSANDPNWYNSGYSWTYSSNGWISVKHSLKDFKNYNHFRLRFYFKGTVPKTGFAFDDIEICDAPVADFAEIHPSTKNSYLVIFQNLSQNFDSCRWNFGDGNYSTLINPQHEYPSSDSVLVTLTVYNQCDSSTISKYVHPIFIYVPDNQLNTLINIYNDNHSVYINASNYNTNNATITITDLLGKTIYTNNIALDKQIVKLNFYSDVNGIYIITLRTNDFIYSQKLIFTR